MYLWLHKILLPNINTISIVGEKGSIVVLPRCHLPHFKSTARTLELVLTGDNTENTKNTVIQR